MGRATDTASAFDAVAVTLNDSTVIPITRGLWVGVTGNIKATMASGSVVTFSAVPVGILPVQVKTVWSAGTTATTILALY